jgi:hypothetical protein
MPGESGVTVVTMLVCSFYFAYEAAGASSARHSLRPLIFQGQDFQAKLARKRAARSRMCVRERHYCNTVDKSPDARADIRNPERYINPARHVRAFGVCTGIEK